MGSFLLFGVSSNVQHCFLIIYLWFCLYLQKLRITSVGVELLDGLSGDVRWCLDFRDMDSPAVILLADNFGKRSQEGGGFVLCPMYGQKWKAFMAASGATNTGIISHLVCSYHSHMLDLSVITDFKAMFGYCTCN